MTAPSSTGTLRVRPYTDADEPAVLELLQAAMGGGPAGARAPSFFRWKHLAGPFGRSFLILAEDSDRVVGLRAFMRWRFTGAGGTLDAVRAVDTATHPDYQGRGIFTRLTMEALDALRDEVDLVFNTPNKLSLPGYLKMGWAVTGRVPISVRVRRPVR
nr:GNAT family N-acetyltransferase [Actinomycetota bacterium]